MATRSATSFIFEVLKNFNGFVNLLEALEAQGRRLDDVHVTGWKDELGRLRVWAANIDAHQTHQASLDYRLRDAPHIVDQVVGLLMDLAKRLDDAKEVLIETLGLAANEEIISDDEGDDRGGDRSDDEQAMSEMEQMRDSVASIIGCLFQMSRLIQKPARHYPRGSAWADVATFEEKDIHHVSMVFPEAPSVLAMRLGNALTKRRMYLRYREKHAAIFKQALGQDDNFVRMSNTAANENPADHNSLFDDRASKVGTSQMSYASELGTSQITTMPPPPDASADKKPFQCPYCYIYTVLDSPDSWAQHVFYDLEPYMCLEINCVTPQRLYATEGEWMHHMRSFHSDDSDPEAVNSSNTHPCPLCRDECADKTSYNMHVAAHLRVLALHVLPRTEPRSRPTIANLSRNTSNSEFQCSICMYECELRSEYEQHVTEVHGEMHAFWTEVINLLGPNLDEEDWLTEEGQKSTKHWEQMQRHTNDSIGAYQRQLLRRDEERQLDLLKQRSAEQTESGSFEERVSELKTREQEILLREKTKHEFLIKLVREELDRMGKGQRQKPTELKEDIRAETDPFYEQTSKYERYSNELARLRLSIVIAEREFKNAMSHNSARLMREVLLRSTYLSLTEFGTRRSQSKGIRQSPSADEDQLRNKIFDWEKSQNEREEQLIREARVHGERQVLQGERSLLQEAIVHINRLLLREERRNHLSRHNEEQNRK